MKVLVTGGAGYIGSETARLLAENGIDVVVVDDLSTGDPLSVESLELLVGNILDEEFLSSVFHSHKFDAVVHFAASKNVGESMRHPHKYWVNNVEGTATLLRQMADHSVNRIVFSSSCSIYGTPKEVPVTENSPVQPESIYAESKYLCERLLHWHELSSGLRSVSLRYFNAAGASLDGKHGENWETSENLIPKVFQVAHGLSERLDIFGSDYETRDGTAVRDYIHVADLAEAHRLALGYLNSDKPSIALNLGTGTGLSVKQVITAVERKLGSSVQFRVVPRRLGDPPMVYANTSLASTVLNWRPRYGIAEIVESADFWYRQLLAKG